MNIGDDYAWSTNKPLLSALVDIVEPKFILELGMGLHSTPIFLKSNCEDIIFIDNDKEWIEHIKKNNVFKPTNEIIFHNLGDDVPTSTFLKQLSKTKRIEIENYYKQLAIRISKKAEAPKLLFVDQFTCCRTLSMNILYKEFDVIVYHDCEPEGILWYEYYFKDDLKSNFDHYVLKTPKSWTGCFIKPILNIGTKLKDDISQYILNYSNEIGLESSKIYLEKEKKFAKHS